MVGLTTLGQPRLSEGAQPYPIQHTKALAGGIFSGPRSRPSVLRFGYSGAGTGSGALPSVFCHRFSHSSFQVPGDGQRGIGHSGVGSQPSAAGPRRQLPPPEIS